MVDIKVLKVQSYLVCKSLAMSTDSTYYTYLPIQLGTVSQVRTGQSTGFITMTTTPSAARSDSYADVSYGCNLYWVVGLLECWVHSTTSYLACLGRKHPWMGRDRIDGGVRCIICGCICSTYYIWKALGPSGDGRLRGKRDV